MDVGRKISLAERIFEAIFGRPTLIALKKPLAVHADKFGRILVVDTGWRKVLVFDFKSHRIDFIGQSGSGLLLNPIGITTDDRGRIFVTDAGGSRVMVYDYDGRFIKAFGGKKWLLRPAGIAVNSKADVAYVCDTWAHQIKVFYIKNGKLLLTIGKKGKKAASKPEGVYDEFWNRGDGDGEFRFPTQIAIDPEGRLYVVDAMNFRVQVLAPNGKFIRKFGKLGNVPGSFFRPRGIGLDSDGHIYVSDAAFNNVQIFDQTGKLLLAFGSFGVGKANLRLPAGLYIDKKDNIYVVDQLNNRVQVYRYLKTSGELGDFAN